ncbi:MAG: SH3 domain-containing C40 family peptidase [Candidatus Limivivens sp.]|nr:SH3 domain-containing C40 family peptidase [Candidatus Limivivens sp.]
MKQRKKDYFLAAAVWVSVLLSASMGAWAAENGIPELAGTVTEENRFFQRVDKVYAIAKVDTLLIYEQRKKGSRAVGSLKKGGICYILKEEDDSWFYMESGVVRGFAQGTELCTGEEAFAYVQERQERNLPLAQPLVAPSENRALTYTKTTVRTTVVAKEYALANADCLNIREEPGTDARIVGRLWKGAFCCVLEDADEEWTYVESGSVRGFVKNEYLLRGREAARAAQETRENGLRTAEELIPPSENAAFYYTMISVNRESAADRLRRTMVNYALQFVGNPYVWGGVSLTEGADCSGFVQTVYADFGYAIPRVAAAQSRCGTKISVSEAIPGDLIFYASGGEVSHVAMAIGNGQVVEAAGSSAGIIISAIDYEHAVWAVRILPD